MMNEEAACNRRISDLNTESAVLEILMTRRRVTIEAVVKATKEAREMLASNTWTKQERKLVIANLELALTKANIEIGKKNND